jgi:hypothetical protein
MVLNAATPATDEIERRVSDADSTRTARQSQPPNEAGN